MCLDQQSSCRQTHAAPVLGHLAVGSWGYSFAPFVAMFHLLQMLLDAIFNRTRGSMPMSSLGGVELRVLEMEQQ